VKDRSALKLRLLPLIVGGLILLAGCAPTPSARNAEGGLSGAEKPAGPPKTLRIAAIVEPLGGIALFGGSGNVGFQWTSTFHAGLTTYDAQGNLIPWVAAKVPSIADGDWKVLPDGGMEVTWKLKRNIKWHDGTPLSAEDFVFGIQIAKDRDLPLPRAGGVTLVRDVSAPDPQTLVIRWAEAYSGANVGQPADFPAVPRHIIADLYRGGDQQAFLNNPYWARKFVGLGPYAIGEWVEGAYTEGNAFDDYFLGRPKIDRVILRYFKDTNSLIASMLSGDTDLVTIATLKMDDIEPIAAGWGPNGGTVIPSFTDAMISRFQFRDSDVPWARDVRVREALVHLVDRQTLADTFSPLGGVADIFAARNDPAFALAEQRGYAKYPYDLARAERLLNDAGWTRGGDGVFQNRAGQKFSIEVRVVDSTPVNSRQGLALVDQWKRGGLESEFFLVGKTATNKPELKAMSKGVFHQSDTLTSDTFEQFLSTQFATEANRWSGRNLTAFGNPEFDRLYEELGVELDAAKGQSKYADLLRWTTQEIPFFLEYYDVNSAITAFRAGIHGPGPIPAISKVATWNIHQWEMD
jgi:peptide/nickel transport system substrate-binding protein